MPGRSSISPAAVASDAAPSAEIFASSASASSALSAASASVTALTSFLNALPMSFLLGSTTSTSSVLGSAKRSCAVSSVPLFALCAFRSNALRSARPTHSIHPYVLSISASQQSSA